MKKRVRVYKSGGDTGMYMNPTAQFLQKAQVGMQQEQPDPQQILSQVVATLAPPPYGQGGDPQAVYQTLAQTYGEETASQLINAAAGYVQQMVNEEAQGAEQEQAQQNASPDLTYQEELIRQEQERQMQDQNDMMAAEDEVFYDDLLFSENPAMQEAKFGGFKKKLVKDTMKLAKKALGDTGADNKSTTADSTDVLNGRQQNVFDFMKSVQNNALLAKMEEQAENMANNIMMPQPNFDQFGGFTGGDLYKFVYGGYDPSIPELENDMIMAQDGVQVSDKWGNKRTVTADEAEKWKSVSESNPETRLSDLSFASQSPVNSPNYKTYEQLKNKGVNVGEYREGIDYSKVPSQSQGAANYNYQLQPYTGRSIAQALRPWNDIFSKSYAISGSMPGMFNPRDLMKQGFTMDKQRMGLGHKRYTFTPGTGQPQSQKQKTTPSTNTTSKFDVIPVGDQTGAQGVRGILNTPDVEPRRESRLAAIIRAKRTPFTAPDENVSNKQPNTMPEGFPINTSGPRVTEQDQMAYGGFYAYGGYFPQAAYGGFTDLKKFQGNVSGSSVNNQDNILPELKPRTPEEVWAKVEPELRKQYGLGDKPKGEIIKDPGSLTIDEFSNFNGENFLNVFNPAMNALAKGIENIGSNRQKFKDQQNLTGDNLFTAVDKQDPGNYNPNSGLFKEREMGQIEFSREGGAKRRTGQQSDWGLGIFPTAMGGADIDQYMGKPAPEVQGTLQPIPRDEANLEAERGETAYGDINGDGFPEHYEIGGKRHSQGGTPLNLPDDTFIFSDTRSMKISDPKILKMFGKAPKKGGYTPAELAKQYDINSYRKILEDPESDVIDRKTAEQMITKYNIKLGALALAQESKKAFPQGIPVVARPYMEMMGLKDEDIIPQDEQPQMAAASPEEMQMMQQVDETGMPPMDQMAMQQADMSGMPMDEMPMAAYGMEMGGYDMPYFSDMYAYGGSLDKYQDKGEVKYDVKDKGLRPDVEGKGYMFVDPGEEFIYNQEEVGPQTPKTGYKVDPESGFWYNPASGKKPGKAGLEDFYRRHKEIIDSYKGGKEAWMKTQAASKGQKNPAMTYVVDKLNDIHKTLTGKEMVDPLKEGAYMPGVELFNLPGLQRKPKEKEEPQPEPQPKPEPQPQPQPKEEEVVEEETINVPIQRDAPWWLQDQLKVAGAFGDLMSIKKYQPWASKYIPEVPNPRYLDPTRAIAAKNEETNILANAVSQFSPSAALASGRLSAQQGQLAKQVADITHQYDTQNVGIANLFAENAANIRNQAQQYNQGVTKSLYDSNVLMNQQYDNAKRALKNNLLNQYISGITNRAKTDALNQMYPQFAVDPSTGGMMHYTGQAKPFRPERTETLGDLYSKYYEATGDKEAAQKFAMLDYKQGSSPSSGDMYPAEAMMSLYDNMRRGGTFVFGPGMLPPMIL